MMRRMCGFSFTTMGPSSLILFIFLIIGSSLINMTQAGIYSFWRPLIYSRGIQTSAASELGKAISFERSNSNIIIREKKMNSQNIATINFDLSALINDRNAEGSSFNNSTLRAASVPDSAFGVDDDDDDDAVDIARILSKIFSGRDKYMSVESGVVLNIRSGGILCIAVPVWPIGYDNFLFDIGLEHMNKRPASSTSSSSSSSNSDLARITLRAMVPPIEQQKKKLSRRSLLKLNRAMFNYVGAPSASSAATSSAPMYSHIQFTLTFSKSSSSSSSSSSSRIRSDNSSNDSRSGERMKESRRITKSGKKSHKISSISSSNRSINGDDNNSGKRKAMLRMTVTSSSHKDMPQDTVASSLGGTIVDFVRKRVEAEIALQSARRVQKALYNISAEKEARKRKELELDKIINPHKYLRSTASDAMHKSGISSGSRSSSSSYGGNGGGGGGGRYKPSAAAQARREIKTRSS